MGTEASKIDGDAAGSIASALKFFAEDPGRVKKLMQSIENKDFDTTKSNDNNSTNQTNQEESAVNRAKPSHRWQKLVDSVNISGPLKRVKARWLKYYRTVDRFAESTFDASAFASAAALASALTNKVVESMGDKLSDPIVAQVCKLRVCFKWIAINIAFDTDAFFRGRSAKVKPTEVMSCRMTVSQGYANLFAALANIVLGEGAARIISGYAKGVGYKVGQSFKNRKPNHWWVMATLGGRKFLFDPTWASGHIENRAYVRKYVEHYWMADPELMLFNHLPEDDVDQLVPEAITLKQFEDMTYFRPGFFFAGMMPRSENARSNKVSLSDGDEELVLRFGAPPTTKVKVTLFRVKDEGNVTLMTQMERCTWVQNLQPVQPLTVMVRPPTPGKYIVRLYARGHQDKGNKHAWAVDYNLDADGYSSPSGFPTTYCTSFKAVLMAPLLNPLTVGMTVNVSVKVMGFHKVLCKPSEGGDKTEIFLQRSGYDTLGYSLFEGLVTIVTPGKLAVAGIAKSSKIHNVFGVYQVVRR